MLVLHLMVKIEFFSEGYKDPAHPYTETLGARRRRSQVAEAVEKAF